ncbi:MAG: glycosyltransferase [Anaerolineales bacterium]
MTHHKMVHIDDYKKYVDTHVIERIKEKAREVQSLHVTHVNSTYYGGGVAELLGSLTLLMNSLDILTGWRVIQGSPDYFSVTKKFHNAIQGDDINLSDLKKNIYEDVVYENVVRNHLDHDRVIIHDPQPLPMIRHYRKRGPWIWHCHIDPTDRDEELWHYLRKFIEGYDAVVFSLSEYKQELDTPQVFFTPALDPFNIKNREMDQKQIQERLDHYNIPTDLPIITQISRFDSWKDPEGVIEAFKLARQDIDATLVLLGNVATDDPEGEQVYHSLLDEREERIIILSKEDTALVNALQRRADVVLQKSIREGFGLTVTEAMWKGTPVIGGNVGGIKKQIKDGENGFLVSSPEQAAKRIVQLVRDEELRASMGEKGRESVRENFLMTSLLENYLDLLNGFESDFRYLH